MIKTFIVKEDSTVLHLRNGHTFTLTGGVGTLSTGRFIDDSCVISGETLHVQEVDCSDDENVLLLLTGGYVVVLVKGLGVAVYESMHECEEGDAIHRFHFKEGYDSQYMKEPNFVSEVIGITQGNGEPIDEIILSNDERILVERDSITIYINEVACINAHPATWYRRRDR